MLRCRNLREYALRPDSEKGRVVSKTYELNIVSDAMVARFVGWHSHHTSARRATRTAFAMWTLMLVEG
jgi:hypothetical protein